MLLAERVSLRPSEQIGLHSQGNWELSYILHGHGRRTIGNVTSVFQEGDMVLVVPGMQHEWSFEDKKDTLVENITVFFDDEFLVDCFSHIPGLSPVKDYYMGLDESIEINTGEESRITDQLEAICRADEKEKIVILMHILLLISNSPEVSSAGKFVKVDSAESKLSKAESYVRSNYNRKIRIKDVASFVGMSETGFCNFWKRMTGVRFWNFLIDQRIDAACGLLRLKDLSVTDVCYESGFSDLAYFCKTFKRIKGVTPTYYRKSHSK